MKEKLITEHLQCVLSPEEKANRADNAARADGEIKRIAEEKAVTVSGYTSMTKEQQRIHDKNSGAVRTGVEVRPVQVRVTYDLLDNIVRYRRLDTEETYERRKLTEEERRVIQAEDAALALPFEDDEPEDATTQAEPHDEQAPSVEIENEWLPLSESRPEPDELVETALFDPESETFKQKGEGYIAAHVDEATATFEDPFADDWKVSHYRRFLVEEVIASTVLSEITPEPETPVAFGYTTGTVAALEVEETEEED